MPLKKIYPFLILIFLPYAAFSQAVIKGTITDENGKAVSGASVSIAGSQIQDSTGTDGAFELHNVPYGTRTLTIRADEFVYQTIGLEVSVTELVLDKITIVHDRQNAGEDIPVTSMAETDIQDDGVSASSSGVLGASNDAFLDAITYNFSISRYRFRGFRDEFSPVYMNGIAMTDLSTGRDMFYTWSGLNDVTRYKKTSTGLEPNNDVFGGMAGSVSIDSRAGYQRRQLQVNYAMSNRSFDNRLMITYGSGVLKGGWIVAASVSHRWANEGYVKGTFYDSWAYFGSVEKTLGSAHRLGLTLFGSALHNGRQSPSTQEMNDISGNNYYNPSWGFQQGEIRNASVGRSHEPVIILNHSWKISNSASLYTSFSEMTGKSSISGLDWYNATDPRPDYYRRLPSYIALTDPNQAAVVHNLLSSSEAERQIKWDDLYQANYLNDSTVYNADGTPGKTVHGRWANYIVQDRVTRTDKTGFNTVFNKEVNEQVHFTAGFSYQHQKSEYYREVNDLLGADFFVDYNQFAEQSNIDTTQEVQNDLNNTNNVLYTGDRYGYNYLADISKTTGWAQGVFRYRLFEYFFAAEMSAVSFFREGKFRNGVFASNSYGKSDVYRFTDYAIKAGITYKLNGRNYFFINGSYAVKAPDFHDAYISPNTRNTVADDLRQGTASTVEGGYLLRAPKLKARAVFYTAEFRDGISTNRFYHDDFRTFVNYTTSGIDLRHIGTELAIEANVGYGFSVYGVACIGKYLFTSNPRATISQDNKDTLLAENETVYVQNFHYGNTPEKAYTLGTGYRGKKFWGVFLSFNFFDDIYIPVNPARRTTAAVDLVDPNSEQYHDIVSQEKASSQMSVDLSGFKSWKLNDTFKAIKQDSYLVLNLGITNLLNNRKFVNGGFEQLRFDFVDKNPDKFASKYYYSYGITFFASVTLRFN